MKKELSSLTVAELKALANKKKIALPSGAKKADILRLLGGKPEKAKTTKADGKKTSAKRKAAAGSAAKPERKKAPAKKKAVSKKRAASKKAAPKKVPARKGGVVKPGEQTTAQREWNMPGGWEAPHAGQEQVTEAKFFTGTLEHRSAMPYDELPHEYGEERMNLLARDPHMAFCFWELPLARLEREKAWFGWDSKLCIRVYDVSGVLFNGSNANAFFDQEVYERVGSWYFDIERPAHSFCADLGLIAPDGRYLTLMRSNPVTMPRDGVSDVLDEEWMLVEEEFMKLYGMPGFGPGKRGIGGMTSAEAQELLRRRRLLEITSPGTFTKPRKK